MMSSSPKILIGCSGSVAAVKLEPLIEEIKRRLPNSSIKVILTKNALHFTERKDDTDDIQYYTDTDEYEAWSKIGDEVLHIELRRWADLLIIAPLSANTLAKISTGICDNLLTCVVRAWNPNRPLLFAPAMNTYMLEHPITHPQIYILRSWGYLEIPTVEKLLACGDRGKGAMASVDTIVNLIVDNLESNFSHALRFVLKGSLLFALIAFLFTGFFQILSSRR